MRKRSEEIIKSLTAHYALTAILNAFDDAKALTRSELKKLLQNTASPSLRQHRSATPKSDGTPAARIKRLLRVEAKLSGSEAIDAVKEALRDRLPQQTAPSGGFDAWLETALKQVPAGEILNAAMTIASKLKKGG